MPAAIPCRAEASHQLCPDNWHCRSLDVQDATQTTLVASKCAKPTLCKCAEPILCKDCGGHCEQTMWPYPTRDGQRRYSWCTWGFRGTQRKMVTIDFWEFVWRNMLRTSVYYFWRMHPKSGPQPRHSNNDQAGAICPEPAEAEAISQARGSYRERDLLEALDSMLPPREGMPIILVLDQPHLPETVFAKLKSKGHIPYCLGGGTSSLMQVYDASYNQEFAAHFVRMERFASAEDRQDESDDSVD